MTASKHTCIHEDELTTISGDLHRLLEPDGFLNRSFNSVRSDIAEIKTDTAVLKVTVEAVKQDVEAIKRAKPMANWSMTSKIILVALGLVGTALTIIAAMVGG